MDLIRASIERPIAVIAVVIMAVLFGALALSRIPVQLAPDVRKPVVVVETAWPGAAPAEIEREIDTAVQEGKLSLEDAEKKLIAARKEIFQD